MESPPQIVLTTDFGLSDPYVGVMKGVILSINPRAAITDLTHNIQAQDLRQAAFVLGSSYRFFPQNAIHVVVVDPGVGTDRKAVLLVTPNARFLAPDNGVLSYVLADYLGHLPGSPGVVLVPRQCAAYHMTNPQYWLHPVSNTFHGRDIFAPVAAHLSLGVEPEKLGSPLSGLVYLPVAQPGREEGRVRGEVIYADHFGNLITNIPGSLAAGHGSLMVEVKGHSIAGLSRTYHDERRQASGELLALIGSHGHLEIAVREGSAALALGAGPGEPVVVLLPGESQEG